MTRQIVRRRLRRRSDQGDVAQFSRTTGMSAFGTKRTFREWVPISAFGGKADIGIAGSSNQGRHYVGRAVNDPQGSWRKVVKAAGLTEVTPHTLRHTRATWLALAGVPLWEAADHLGMTTRTLERVYAHHHPDWQERAANI